MANGGGEQEENLILLHEVEWVRGCIEPRGIICYLVLPPPQYLVTSLSLSNLSIDCNLKTIIEYCTLEIRMGKKEEKCPVS